MLNKLELKVIQLQKELNEVKLEVASEHNKPWPQIGNVYYVPTGHGASNCINREDQTDKYFFDRDLCFKTGQEAIDYKQREDLYIKIRNDLKIANGDWMPDWSDDEKKWCVTFDHVDKAAYFISGINIQSSKYTAKSASILTSLSVKYGDINVCKAFGIL